MVSTDSLIRIFILFALLRPNFYMVSPLISRALEGTTTVLLILLLVHLSTSRTNPWRIRTTHLAFLTVSYCLIAITYSAASLNYALGIEDAAEWLRPLLLGAPFLLGYYYARDWAHFRSVLVLIGGIGFIHLFVALLQASGVDGGLTYWLYTSPNLYEQGRPGGVGYSHTEYAALILLSALAYFWLYVTERRRSFLWYGLILFFFSPLSASKAGVVLAAIFACLCLWKVVQSAPFYIKISAIAVIAIVSAIVLYLFVQIITDSYIYKGFESLLDYRKTKNESITNRLNDLQVLYHIWQQFDYRILIGSSPLRLYSDESYIEISTINFFFRFGVLGFALYYWFILQPLFFRRYVRSGWLLAAFSIALFAADWTANVSETIKFSIGYAFLLGAFLRQVHIGKLARSEADAAEQQSGPLTPSEAHA